MERTSLERVVVGRIADCFRGVVVYCRLTYATARTYYEPLGYDITNTYYLELSLKNNKSDSYIPKGQKETTTDRTLLN